MRLTLVISTLQAGGAERVMAILANTWVQRGNCVTLITLGPAGNDFYPLDPRVCRIGLNLIKNTRSVLDKLRTGFRRVSTLRQSLRASAPDAIISFIDQTNLLTLIATRGLSCPVIVSERIDPRQEPCSLGGRLLRHLLYPRAEALVVQTNSVRAWARQFVPQPRVAVIPNPVAPPSNIWSPTGDPKIVAIGRLHRQKGFDLLIEAFARIAPHHPQWSLEILGEGPERVSLESLIRTLEMSDRVTLRGLVSDITPHLVAAGLFVMPSRYEGFPNALVEAMACGCPVLATDCPSGPGEIIRDGIDGWLVPSENVTALADGLSRLMTGEADRQRLGANASAVLERFGIDRVLELWDNLIYRLSDQSPDNDLSNRGTPPAISRRAA